MEVNSQTYSLFTYQKKKPLTINKNKDFINFYFTLNYTFKQKFRFLK